MQIKKKIDQLEKKHQTREMIIFKQWLKTLTDAELIQYRDKTKAAIAGKTRRGEMEQRFYEHQKQTQEN
jgi:hypothetical protein